MQIKRRTMLASTAAAAATAATSSASAQSAAPFVGVKIDPWNQPPELQAKWRRGDKFLEQDDESRQDFTRGVASMGSRDPLRNAKQQAMAAFLRSKGINPLDDVKMKPEQAYALLTQNPVYAADLRLDRSSFALHWDNPRRAFHKNRAHYIGLMEKAEKSGIGKLELNPKLDMPDSTRHEIHSMPGGYVGEEFAGWIYEIGHIAGTDSLNDRGRPVSYAQAARAPDDGKVRRILDVGCSMGASTMALKLRFPDAEVWGLDVGGPLLRFAHYKADLMGLDVNFRQADAAKSGFPDNYFDIVGSLIVFHEVAPEERGKLVKEFHRILRPGGVYHHADFMTAGHPKYSRSETVTSLAGSFNSQRLNVESWSSAYTQSDFPGLMRAVGFTVDFSGKPTGNAKGAQGGFPHVSGIKPMQA